MTAHTACYLLGTAAFAVSCFAGPDQTLRFIALVISQIWYAAGFIINTRESK